MCFTMQASLWTWMGRRVRSWSPRVPSSPPVSSKQEVDLYLVQVKLDLISSLQVVCCGHLVDHVPPCLDHSLHRVGHVLRGHTRVTTCWNTSPSHQSPALV